MTLLLAKIFSSPGVWLIFTYDSAVAYGQSGFEVVCILDRPERMMDSHSTFGFPGDVDNHYKRLIRITVLSNLFSADSNSHNP